MIPIIRMFIVNENKRRNSHNILRDFKNKLNVFDWIHFVCKHKVGLFERKVASSKKNTWQIYINGILLYLYFERIEK